MTKTRLLLTMLFLSLAIPGLAVDIPTPDGFEPWFSVDGSWTTPNVIIRPSSESVPDWRTIIAEVVASNPEQSSVPSDPSVETLIVPAGTATPVPGWTGPVVIKSASGVLGVTFSQGTGTVTRYTVFRKLRAVYGACGKPGIPGVVP